MERLLSLRAKKGIIQAMTYKSTAIINKEGKWFVARSAELGVVSQGKTVEEARKNLEEGVKLYKDYEAL